VDSRSQRTKSVEWPETPDRSPNDLIFRQEGTPRPIATIPAVTAIVTKNEHSALRDRGVQGAAKAHPLLVEGAVVSHIRLVEINTIHTDLSSRVHDHLIPRYSHNAFDVGITGRMTDARDQPNQRDIGENALKRWR
jgi:hypothetical protein